jgi:hypothetical protein
VVGAATIAPETAADPAGPFSEAEARLEPPPQLDTARNGLNAPDELAQRCEPAALRLERLRRPQLERATLRASTSRANTASDSTSGKQSQSIEPFDATSATVRPSPIAA